MGTSQRYTPGVTGEPNWGNISTNISSIARIVSDELKLSQEEEDTENQDQNGSKDYKKIYDKLAERKEVNLSKLYKNLIKNGGGKKNILSGKSKTLGKAALKNSRNFVSIISSIGSSGLEKTLADFGLANYKNKSFEQILDFLLATCSNSSEGMDETAANKASCEILNELAKECNNDLEVFEEKSRELLEENGLSDLLCKFWGLYIFEHLSQMFLEKLTQSKGDFISKETFKIIKDDILGQVQVLNSQRSIEKIDWTGSEGEREINKIFKSILDILSDEED